MVPSVPTAPNCPMLQKRPLEGRGLCWQREDPEAGWLGLVQAGGWRRGCGGPCPPREAPPGAGEPWQPRQRLPSGIDYIPLSHSCC